MADCGSSLKAVFNPARDVIDLSAVARLYGPHGTILSVKVKEMFLPQCQETGRPGSWVSFPASKTLEAAFSAGATRLVLDVLRRDGTTVNPEFAANELIRPRFDRTRPRTYLCGRLMLQFLEDRDTPVLVVLRHGNGKTDVATGTYGCVTAESEVDGYPLSESQSAWLSRFEDEADEWDSRLRG